MPIVDEFILSGLLTHERAEILQAFAALELFWEKEEDGWTGLVLRLPH